ncbi:MAG: DUF433 domain-containing protein [Phycisphaeraceae bacterium]|nr:DUF433 domain-containing protein [Phycisphaeraceae bacterium]
MNLDQAIHCQAGLLGGRPVFVDTRVPVESLFLYLKSGGTLEQFLVDFPGVTREQAAAALDAASQALSSRATAA